MPSRPQRRANISPDLKAMFTDERRGRPGSASLFRRCCGKRRLTGLPGPRPLVRRRESQETCDAVSLIPPEPLLLNGASQQLGGLRPLDRGWKRACNEAPVIVEGQP